MKVEGIVIVFKIQTSYPSQYRNMLSNFSNYSFKSDLSYSLIKNSTNKFRYNSRHETLWEDR